MLLKSFVETDQVERRLFEQLCDKMSKNTERLDAKQVINASYCFNYAKCQLGGEYFEELLGLLAKRF